MNCGTVLSPKDYLTVTFKWSCIVSKQLRDSTLLVQQYLDSLNLRYQKTSMLSRCVPTGLLQWLWIQRAPRDSTSLYMFPNYLNVAAALPPMNCWSPCPSEMNSLEIHFPDLDPQIHVEQQKLEQERFHFLCRWRSSMDPMPPLTNTRFTGHLNQWNPYPLPRNLASLLPCNTTNLPSSTLPASVDDLPNRIWQHPHMPHLGDVSPTDVSSPDTSHFS